MKLRIFHLFVLGLVFCGLHMLQRPRIPRELVGTWTTTAPRYSGASLEITPTLIVFRNGTAVTSSNIISGVEQKHDGKVLSYTIRTTNAAGVSDTVLVGCKIEKGTAVLWFANQKKVAWVKADDL